MIEHQTQGLEVMLLWLQDRFFWLGFSPEAAKLLVREQGLDRPERLGAFMDKNVNEICNVMKKPGGKNVEGLPNRGQKVSVIAHKNLKLASFYTIIG